MMLLGTICRVLALAKRNRNRYSPQTINKKKTLYTSCPLIQTMGASGS